jgi:hypothetical protein
MNFFPTLLFSPAHAAATKSRTFAVDEFGAARSSICSTVFPRSARHSAKKRENEKNAILTEPLKFATARRARRDTPNM